MAEIVNLSYETMTAFNNGVASAQQFDSSIMLWLLIFGAICSVMIILWIYLINDAKQSRFLRFNTEGEARIVHGNIDNQLFMQKNKAWHIMKTKPIILNTKFGKRPLYIIKDDVSIPFIFEGKHLKLSSESLKNFTEHENIKTIIKLTSKNKGEIFLFIAIGLVIGILVGIIGGQFLR